jgi:hypothetical protein
MTTLRTASLGLVALLTACGQTDAPQTLHGGVTRVSSEVTRDADAMTTTGQLRVQGDAGLTDVRYTVVGAPAATPETFDIELHELSSGASAHVLYNPEWRTWTVKVADQLIAVAHNPDGSFSVGDVAFDSVDAAARALVKGGALDALTPALLVASSVVIGDAMAAANTRIPDGYCDPLFFSVDPDCRPPGLRIERAYACERWGEESAACGFYEGAQPSR